ncbi:cell division protein FtsK [Cryobacterium roopkundense]|uniref:Cell division protein FtsK n=1 Tax=Cryobacterium roopkundense TaxID=1001240 RepID=A0A099JPX1_9MICO|nr:FtsK/SpoIIIE domain-containing protein [Cryobacterium roopkundense]KGJ79652.1 cell division protein FtsK [Cryobacterium roopkundense]MBB5642492.1 S-DNA-T family DNA segregation ATPase FtsK/SpoIIIE [Cryobacterium roopkundense]
MRLKLTLQRAGLFDIDVSLTADATAYVGDIATTLYAADPLRAGALIPERLTLQVRGDSVDGAPLPVRVIDPAIDLTEAGLRSGAVVELVQASEDFVRPGENRGPAAARVSILSGPDAGRDFDIPFGASTVGRDYGVDVRLGDPLVSKRHARINVADGVEILDLGSANGILMGGELVSRTQLSAADVVNLGDTELSVSPLQQLASAVASAPVVEFVRSPRVVGRYPGIELLAPTAPKAPQKQRFPYLSIVAPIIMGVVLFLVTKQLLSLAFVALSPLLVVGAFVDGAITSRRTLKAQIKQFEAALLASEKSQVRAHEAERLARLAESPSLAEVIDAVRRRGPIMWTHRPEHEGFLTARLGLGQAPSRSVLALPGTNDSLPEYWERLEAAALRFSVIDDVPITVDWRSSGALGLVGAREQLDGVARGILLQTIGLHSPAELVVTAFTSPSSRATWGWLQWLPHTSSPHSPIAGDHLADNPGGAQALLARLEALVDERVDEAALRGALPTRDRGSDTEEKEPARIPAVIVLIENDAPVDRGRITRLAERGADANVHVIWCAASVDRIPAVCRSFLVLDTVPGVPGPLVGHVRVGERSFPVATETLTLAAAERLARALAPVVDVGSPVSDDSDLPRSVSYASLSGLDLVNEADAVTERWRENNSLTPRDGSAPVRRKKDGNLRALVGHAGSEPFHLDLRSQGPHALVGGTTGAGKSEFLQSWVLGMAAAHSPDRATFLFVDYKGGTAFAECVGLPHTVGLVTDLSPHLVRRALTSLRAELRYREHLLNRKNAKDLVSLEKTGDPETPPSLVIIVDEFAALATEVPEFVDGVVDVAQRGRSLGLHLILATQRPAGVIKDNLRANTNLRIALRMADAEDSSDILGTPMAAQFDPAIPGRGAAKTGPGRITTFQTGYAGGWTTDTPPRPRIDVNELGFGSGADWDMPEVELDEVAEPGPTDISRMVTTITEAAARAGVPAPRKPWLDELAAVYDFSVQAHTRVDGELLLGVIDDPATQAQPTLFYRPDRDGNMAIFGAGGSGKSAALRTIAVAAAFAAQGGQVQVYGLDFGAGGLSMLEDLPNVGAIISGDDDERVTRLLRSLRDIVDDRAVRFAAVRAGTIGEYRRLANKPDEPRILLLVDGIGAFREAYEFASNSQWFAVFAQIAVDGRQLGVHVVMTGDRPNSVPTSISSTVQKRLVLRLATDDDYLMLGVPKDVLSVTSPPGRGIIDGNEVQLAILGASSNLTVQSREVERLAASMRRQHFAVAPGVGRLPERAPLAELPTTDARGLAVVGLADVNLAPIGVEARGAFLLSGPPGSGRTTALATFAAALERGPGHPFLALFGSRRTPLAQAAGFGMVANTVDAVLLAATRLTERIEAGEFAPGALAVLIEGITDFTSTDAESAVDRLVKAAVRADTFVVGESESSTWQQAYTLAAPFKAGRRGLLLVPGEMDGDMLLGTPLGRIKNGDFPPGRGFLIAGGRAVRAQIAVAT